MRIFPSKLLLFGEYLVVAGGAALAVPYPRFSGHWNDQPEDSEAYRFSQAITRKLIAHYRQSPLSFAVDWDRLEGDLQRGRWFAANVPFGYGLGSSGTLAAAIYADYALHPSLDLLVLKTELAELEGYFHGKSSGLDPLVSYLDRPLRLGANQIEPLDSLPDYSQGSRAIFLWDTGLARQAAPLVQHFLQQLESPEFKAQALRPLQAASDAALAAFLQQDSEMLIDNFKKISHLHFNYFKNMIPDALLPVWRAGAGAGDFYLKICGAGGGGFMLGLTENWEEVKGREEVTGVFWF